MKIKRIHYMGDNPPFSEETKRRRREEYLLQKEKITSSPRRKLCWIDGCWRGIFTEEEIRAHNKRIKTLPEDNSLKVIVNLYQKYYGEPLCQNKKYFPLNERR